MQAYLAKFFWAFVILFTVASGSLGFVTAKISVESVYAGSFDQQITGNPTDLIKTTGERFGQSDEPRDPRNLAFSIVRGLLATIGMALLIMFLYAGFLWFSARGNDDQVTKAKATLRNAVIGLLIVGFSYALVTFVFNTVFEPGFSDKDEFDELLDGEGVGTTEESRIQKN